MTTAIGQTVITVPGVYDIPADLYHLDPVEGGSLSASTAKRLLPPSCPAKYHYQRGAPAAPKTAWDIGHAAHKVVLGSGPDIVRINADEWRTNAIKAEVADVREAGGVPLKPKDYDRVHEMAAALQAHPYAAKLFDPTRGKAEQTLVWQDRQAGIWCRARLDYLPDPIDGRRMLVPDYKSADSACPDKLPKAFYDWGYHLSAAWYLDGVEQLGLSIPGAVFMLVVQEKEPPYLVTVTELTYRALHIGRIQMRHAREEYARCVATNHWPAYTDDVIQTGLPGWVEAQYESEFRR